MRPRSPFTSERRGVTLLELLVVLLLLGVTAAVVAPSLPRRATDRQDSADAILATARRTAIRRGEPVRLRLDGDGVWALVAMRDGEPLASGRVAVRTDSDTRTSAVSPVSPDGEFIATPVMVVTIDAMGNCVPSSSGAATRGRFDALRCAWESPVFARSPTPSPQP